MIFEGDPGRAQAERIRSGEGERLIGGPTNLHPVLPQESKGYRIHHTGCRIRRYVDTGYC